MRPHVPYTFKEFERRIRFDERHYKDSVKRAVFSFYQTWNGEPLDFYKRKRNNNTYINHEIRQNTFFIVVDEDSCTFEIKNQNNLNKTSPSDVLHVKNDVRFFEYTEYGDWGLIRRKSDLSENADYIGFLLSIESFKNKCIKEIEDFKLYHCEEYLFGICESRYSLDDICNRFNVHYEKDQKIMSLLGGIKIAHGVYATEAAPVLYFREPQKEIYVNYDKKTFPKKISSIRLVDLLGDISCADYYLKLPCSAPLKVSFGEFNITEHDYSCSGWRFEQSSIHICNEQDEYSLIGLNCTITQSFEDVSNCESNERLFIKHKRNFERNLIENRGAPVRCI